MDMDIEYVSKLARIDLSPQQRKKLAAQLGDILAYIEKLKQLDLNGVEPMSHVLPLKNVFREDKVAASLAAEKVLGSAPSKTKNNFFSVPKVIE